MICFIAMTSCAHLNISSCDSVGSVVIAEGCLLMTILADWLEDEVDEDIVAI